MEKLGSKGGRDEDGKYDLESFTMWVGNKVGLGV